MATTKKKIIATVIAVMLAMSTALGLFVSSASAVDMGGAYNSAKVISTSISKAVWEAAKERQKTKPVVWLNIKKHGYKVNSSSGGSWGSWNSDVYYVSTTSSNTSKSGDIELTYPNAGYVSTTGDAVDLHVKAHLWCEYVASFEGQTEKREAMSDLNCKNLTCDGGNPGHAGIQFSMWVTKKGKSAKIDAYIPMVWGDIDQPTEPGVYGGVESVGLTSSAENVFTGTAVSGNDGHMSRYTPDGQTLDPSGGWNDNYYPYDGVALATNTWNGKFFYSGSHDCHWTEVGDYYDVKRDSCLGLIGHTSTSSTFDVEWTASTLGCTTTFGLFSNTVGDPDFGYLVLGKTSSNADTTESPLCPEFYSLEDTAFKVVCVSSDYINPNVTLGTFKCAKAAGGTCTVTSGATKGDSTTTLALPPGKYDIIETAAPKLGYMSQVGTTVQTVTIEDGKTTKLTGKKAIKNKPMARVVVEKISDEPGNWSYGLATYSRAGAQYGIYTDEAGTSQVADSGPANNSTLTTRYEQEVVKGTSGAVLAGDGKYVLVNPAGNEREAVTKRVRSNVMMVPPDVTYYMKETTASEGYVLDTTAHSFTPAAGELTTVQSTETPSESPIHIYKNDASFKYLTATGKNAACANFLHGGNDWRAQGDATLTGAWYLVNYYDGYYTSIPSGTPTRSWRIRTGTDSQESGEAFLDNYATRSLSHMLTGSGATFITSAKGSVPNFATVPLGTITITELKPPQGYTMKNASLADPYVYLSQVRRVNQTTVKANFPDAYKRTFATTTTADAGVASVRTYTVGGALGDAGLDANIDVSGNLEVFNVVIRADAHMQKTDWDEMQLRDGYDPGNPWRVPDWSDQRPEGNATLKGSVFEVVNTSINPVISPTDGTSVIWPGSIADGSLTGAMPTGKTPVSVDKRSSGVNCYLTTDEKGYATTKAGAGVNNYVTAWKKGARNNQAAYTATDGNTRAWTTPGTWTGALAYGTYVTQEVKEPDYGYLLNPGYRGKVVTRIDKADDLIKATYAGDPATWHSPDEAKKYWFWKWYRDGYRAAPLPALIV